MNLGTSRKSTTAKTIWGRLVNKVVSTAKKVVTAVKKAVKKTVKTVSKAAKTVSNCAVGVYQQANARWNNVIQDPSLYNISNYATIGLVDNVAGVYQRANDRWNGMIQDPSLYTVVDYATLGTVNNVDRVVSSEPFSEENWAASFELFGRAVLVYGFAKSAVAANRGNTTYRQSTNTSEIANQAEGSNSWYKDDGSINYPPNNGAVAGTEKLVDLQSGSTFGRYGGYGNNSSFVTAPGSSPNSLSLPPNTNPSIYQEFTIKKVIPGVTQSTVAEWPIGSGMGGGIQFER